MILRIVKRRFAAVGVDPALIGTHTLRHTAAALRYCDGQGQDITEVSALLNHSSIAVTQRYLGSQSKPVDCGWTAVEQSLAL
jgi:integrase